LTAIPATRPQNALGFSTKNTLVSKLPFKSQDKQISTSAKDQFNLYIKAQQEPSKVTSILPNTTDLKELDKLAKKIANLQSIIDLKPSRCLFSEEHEPYTKCIQ
jgi:hypothetical protein